MIFLYIDPGAGSLLVQALLAGLLAVPFFLRTQIARIVDRVRHRAGPDDGGPDARA